MIDQCNDAHADQCFSNIFPRIHAWITKIYTQIEILKLFVYAFQASLEEMCPSWLKEMRGPQYGDLQWVLGMHRDRHLHFPNGNSARQDLGGEEVLEVAPPVATGQGPTAATNCWQQDKTL